MTPFVSLTEYDDEQIAELHKLPVFQRKGKRKPYTLSTGDKENEHRLKALCWDVAQGNPNEYERLYYHTSLLDIWEMYALLRDSFAVDE